ncbi:protease pro-enzyme activation domain-containing protein [Paraburkholderia fungorum]|uniref:Peptidase S53 n=1 Tax=Paraburkholderia fungorum TaxID=134537 RepID=A0A3R7HJG5_9BURK|nr:S53 family peptidase [Paraburkholderia fungorum]RKF30542.1 peptidase S53 [Paraburkholderia fungorum]
MTGISLKGSERKAFRGARSVGKADPTERLIVTVIVKGIADDKLKETADKAGLTPRSHLSRANFATQFGARADAVAAVKNFAATHGLGVVDEHHGSKRIRLSGTVAQFNDAFGVDLQTYEYAGGKYRGREGAVHLPAELEDSVVAVLGLDNRPQAQPHIRRRNTSPAAAGHAAPADEPQDFTPNQVATMYGFPAGTGLGQCIALIELGGGYATADLGTYFGELGIATPNVSVAMGENTPTGNPSDNNDGEVNLDIDVAGAIAPQANIVLYFAQNSDDAFLNAVTTAIHDTTNNPSVISISWGGAESTWTSQSMTAFDQAFQAAATMGITVCVATGDNGSTDGQSDDADHADFPASSPYALACGGTSIAVSGGQIESETVWNNLASNDGATGGGVSSFFPIPSWQSGLQVTETGGASSPLTMRGIPDVSGDADPDTGYATRVDGQDQVAGGTSAVAPLWAALIARVNANNGSSAGYINPRLYASAGSLKDIISGNNGTYYAAPGWDACTGLGSPNGPGIQGVV